VVLKKERSGLIWTLREDLATNLQFFALQALIFSSLLLFSLPVDIFNDVHSAFDSARRAWDNGDR